MMAAFLFFANKRRKAEAAQDLQISALGARGEPKDVKETIKKLSGD